MRIGRDVSHAFRLNRTTEVDSKGTAMDLAFEARMLIDGKLVEAEGGRTYDNVNPATETVIGPVADGSPGDMQGAISAARRAFDETGWSTDRAFRKTCLEQLKAALDKHKEDLRPQIVAEV